MKAKMTRRQLLKQTLNAGVSIGALGFMPSAHAWNASRMRKPRRAMSAIAHMTKIGMTSNLMLCLDAGDSLSYASGQTFSDRSGNGHHFAIGESLVNTNSDPVFTGTAGNLSSNEYFAFDGSMIFRYPNANPAWMHSLHKDNVQWTYVIWAYIGALANFQALFGTRGPGATNTGVRFNIDNTGGFLGLQVTNAGSHNLNLTSSTIAPNLNTWEMFAVSVQVTSGAYNVTFYKSGTSESFSGTYAGAISTADSSVLAEVAGAGSGNNKLSNGSRVSTALAWSGQALSVSQLNQVFSETKIRYGL